MLACQLPRAAKAGTIGDLTGVVTVAVLDSVPVADDEVLPYSAPWEGPVVDAWRKNLTRIDALPPY